MNTLALGCMLGLATAVSVVSGCAGDRPMRNGAPNELLFLKKAFIIRAGKDEAPDKPSEDTGWMLKASVMSTSTPNPLSNTVLWPGAENNGMLVRFVATQDKLQLVNMRELSDDKLVEQQGTRNPEVVNAWNAQHGDLKLAVTADGEKTNRLEINQELDWRVRQWVQVDLAKSDLSDFALFGNEYSFLLQKCTQGASTTVVPGSILVDEDNDYLEWKVNVTLPIRLDDEKCMEAFGETGRNFSRMGRSNVTAVVKYSMVRAKKAGELTYTPLEIPENDPIRRKYGAIWQTSWARDQRNSGLVAARQFAIRFDPNKEFVMYFAKGYPEEKKGFFKDPGGIIDQTNAIFEKAGAKIRLVVKNFDEDIPPGASKVEKERGREYGDIRYSFIRWMSDPDVAAPFIGVSQFVPDPRTGEALSASINIADFPLQEFVGVRVDAFLESIMCRASGKNGSGAETCQNYKDDKPWGPPMVEVKGPDGKPKLDESGKPILKALPAQCRDGETAPLLPTKLNETYGISALYSKMQQYLGEPASQYGPLGPRDFVAAGDADFENAYAKVVPYYVFADPELNPFVTPVGNGGEFGPVGEEYEALGREAAFHKLAGKIDRGEAPFDLSGGRGYVAEASTFLDAMQQGLVDHNRFMNKREFRFKAATKMDLAGDLVSFTGVMERAGRRCVGGKWETREEWMRQLIQTYHALTVWHEFGHVLGLDHNFMGSVDKSNFPHFTAEGCDKNRDSTKCDRVGLYSSSVMEYSATPDRIFWANETGGPGWAPYDRGAIAWLYGNEAPPSDAARAEAQRQAKAKPPELVSGQLSPTLPWKDPAGFRADGKEISFLYCNASHLRFTPFCRQQDIGVTPSEIIANEIEAYEWQYEWRNFRKYRKTWDLSHYADVPARAIIELRRFLPIWRSDWRDDTLRDDFGRFGIEPPPGANSRQLYFQQLATKFDDELSQTNQMVAAFHQAIIQQSAGERPFATVYDKSSGAVTQQGITLDKQFAMQGWVGLWQSDNYDPNQRGDYMSSYGDDFDPEYNSVAQRAVASMIGQETFDSYPGLQIAAVVLFARDTHKPMFDGMNQIKDWVGGYVFSDERKALTFFRRRAVERGRFTEPCVAGQDQKTPCGCTTIESCTYDPRIGRGDTDHEFLSDPLQEFLAPDNRHYIWLEIPDRQWWVFVDRTRNIATYKKMKDFHTEITAKNIQDDRLYTALLPIKTHLDAYIQYNDGPPTD